MATTALTASKTPGIIVAEIRMMSATFSGVHFLVEGDDDSKFWKPRVSSASVTIVSCEGKPNLLGASALIQRLGISSVAGVYDPDFERLFGVSHHPNILAPTDHNDLELTLIASDALSSLLHEFGDPGQIADFESNQGKSVADHLEATSRQFGQLRYLNEILRHQVDFDRLSPYRFVSADTWTLDRPALISEYAILSGLAVPDVETLIQTHCPQAPTWCLSQGHDTVRVLAQGLRRRIGRKQMSEQDVARVLRIAFSLELLQRSGMYRSLRTLESRLPAPLFS
ncbi:MAG: DUF4435 domain-containing protein [Rubrivivax sp.]|nr:DUF4435 domain-containing protein [Rubrivivax sp.]